MKDSSNPKGRISDSPGNFRGLDVKPQRNYNAKPPKLGGGQGIKAPAVIAKALGVQIGMPVHQAAVSKLVNHPDDSVVRAAKALLAKY